VLAVPRAAAGPDRVLLAYDGSPKADEALFVAAYLAEAWSAPLAVVSVIDRPEVGRALDRARQYLAVHEVAAAFHIRYSGLVPEAVLEAADAHGATLIAIGGYTRRPVVEVVLGSAVDQVLRQSSRPVFICR